MTKLSRLSAGQAFRVWIWRNHYVDYKLIHVNECRAYVEPLNRGKKTDILEDAPGGRVSISPNIECEIIDEELDEIMKPTTGPKNTGGAAAGNKTTTTTPAKGPKATRNSDRKYDSRKQDRPVRQGTIRADLLAAIEGGNSDIPKLMKQFNMARSLLVAHVHEMWNCHGYGYIIQGDVVKIIKPIGGVLKTTEPAKKKAGGTPKKKATAPIKDPLADDDEDALA